MVTNGHRTRSFRLIAPALAVGLTLALAGCGGSSDDSSASGPTTTAKPATGSGGLGDATADSSDSDSAPTTDQAASLPDDPCSLLPADQVTALLGTSAPGTAGPSSADPAIASCQWGELTTDAGQVSVGLSAPSGDAHVDYQEMLVSGVGAQGTPSSVGTDGKVLDVFIRPGGGGLGKTVYFKQNGVTVLVGQSGSNVDTAKLEAAASQVAGAL